LMESSLVEVIDKAPKTQWKIDWKAVPDQFKKAYQNANFDNLMALFYDSSKGKMPLREEPIQVHAGLAQATQRAWENVKGAMGLFQDAFENSGVDASGVALQERASNGESVSFPYLKALKHAMKFEAQLHIDMIPRVISTQRVQRIVMADGTEDYIEVNKLQWNGQAGKYMFANELTHQTMAINIDMGPSQRTQRQEASDTLLRMLEPIAQTEPRLIAPLIKLIADNGDFAASQDFSELVTKVMDPIFLEAGKETDEPELTPERVEQLISEAVSKALEDAGVEMQQFRDETERMEATAERISAAAKTIEAQANMLEARAEASAAGVS